VGALGHPSDDETGLIYMRARYYDPACGRFVSQDPAKDGTNWFAYCDRSPTNRTDATGRLPGWVQTLIGWLVDGFEDEGIEEFYLDSLRNLATPLELSIWLEDAAATLLRQSAAHRLTAAEIRAFADTMPTEEARDLMIAAAGRQT
jgi:RHS repeat-associated protein